MATVCTDVPAVIRNFDSLVIRYPYIFKYIKENDINKSYGMPKSTVTYHKPRRLSEEQRIQARERMNQINNSV